MPEMAYTSEDLDESGVPIHRGEVCFRGFNSFKGYFKIPKENNEAIDEDGWVHTGDIGMFLPDGTLKIIDRRKNILKLSQVQRRVKYCRRIDIKQGLFIIPEKL
jgi:long-chain acyl-CoA synthetase